MKTAIGMVCLLIVVMASALPAAADTRYVSDRLYVTVRASQAPGSEVLATVTSNDPLEVLEEGDELLKVRTKEGIVGFIRAQYVTKETPKSIVVDRLGKEVDRLNKRIEELKAAQSPQAQELENLRENSRSLENTLSETRKELETVTGKYNTLVENSKHVAELTAEHDRLQQENKQLTEEMSSLQEENTQLLRHGMIQWFIAGAGVFLVGWVIGKISRKQKRLF